jgi:hydrogenase nickel incorporation protein HypA/HybF
MHELAITQSVVEAVTERTGTTPVAVVRLRVGRLAGVVPDAMRFCFELVTAGTPLEGAELEIEQPEGRGRCRTCDAEFRLPDLVLLCDCGSADVEVLAGRELSVVSVVLADRRAGV